MNNLGFKNILNIKNPENEDFSKKIIELNKICKVNDNKKSYLIMNINEEENKLDNNFFVITKDLFLKGEKNENELIENKFKCNIQTNLFKFNGEVKEWCLSKGELIMNDFKFNGSFNNNLPINGKIIYTNGDIYEGFLQNGNYHGHGSLKTSDLYYIGNFDNHKFTGNGCLTENKIIYEGIFLNGKKHGEGILTEDDNKEYSVIYDNGELVEKISLIEVKYNEGKEIIKNLEIENKYLEEQKEVLEGQIKVLKESTSNLTCKICFERNVEIVFKPCGHLCACRECTDRMFGVATQYHNSRSKVCPVCRKNVTSKIEVLIA